MTPDEIKAFVLQIQRDAFRLLTMDLHGEDTRHAIAQLFTETPEALRASYLATLVHEMTTGFASALVLLHGSPEQAVTATRAMALKFETLAPDLGLKDL